MKRDVPTLERVRELFDYDRERGVLIRRITTSSRGQKGTVICKPSPNGYITVQINRTRFSAHHLIWVHVTGQWPTQQIDHINVDKTDNRWINLREASPLENARNRKKLLKSSSPYKGVYPHQFAKGFAAGIRVAGKYHYLGSFKTAEEAHAAYVSAARKHFGEFARAS